MTQGPTGPGRDPAGPGVPPRNAGPAGDHRSPGPDGEQPRITIRDKRRLDPETGDVRPGVPDADQTIQPPANPFEPPPTAASVSSAEIERLTTELAERTSDLQRVNAEYANYRRRVDRDRALSGEVAQERVLAELLPVLDDVDRAAQHGDLTGSTKVVADALLAVLRKHGVEPFGEPGDPFDPNQHEAVAHSTSAEVEGPTAVAVMRRGYRRGDRVLRTAMVAVADPE